MYIIFGVSNKNKVLAKSMQPISCNHCGTTQNWAIYKSRPYFTLFFFLKIFPIGKAQYIYSCPKCKYGFDITSNNINAILGEVQMTNALNNELNSDSFRKYMAKMDANIGYNNQNQQVGMQQQPMQNPNMGMNNNFQQPMQNPNMGMNNNFQQPMQQPAMNNYQNNQNQN